MYLRIFWRYFERIWLSEAGMGVFQLCLQDVRRCPKFIEISKVEKMLYFLGISTWFVSVYFAFYRIQRDLFYFQNIKRRHFMFLAETVTG